MTTTPTPWHALGHDASDASNAAAALALGGLTGWGIRHEPMHVTTPTGTLTVPDRFAQVAGGGFNGTPAEVLGIVGREATYLQNEAYAPLLDGLADETGATFAAAGTAGSMARAFVTLQMPGYVSIEGGRVRLYLALVVDRDGFAKRRTGATVTVTAVHEGTGAVLPVLVDPVPVGPDSEPRRVVDALLMVVEEAVTDWRSLAASPLEVTPRYYANVIMSAGSGGPKARAAADANVGALLEYVVDGATPWDVWVAACVWHDTLFPTRGGNRDVARRVRALLDPAWKTSARAVLTNRLETFR